MQIGRCVTDGVEKGGGGGAKGPLTECHQEGDGHDGNCWASGERAGAAFVNELGRS